MGSLSDAISGDSTAIGRDSEPKTAVVAGRRRLRMPADMLDAFEPGWTPPPPWQLSTADPIRQEAVRQLARRKSD